MKKGIELLNEIIEQSGLKKSYLADACGISRMAFYQKAAGKRTFNAVELRVLKRELHLTANQIDEIFLQ